MVAALQKSTVHPEIVPASATDSNKLGGPEASKIAQGCQAFFTNLVLQHLLNWLALVDEVRIGGDYPLKTRTR